MATIAEEISALRERISQAYDVIDQKGGDVPEDRTSWNLSASIDSIRTGDADPAAIVPVRYLKSTGTQYIDTEAYIANTAASRPRIEIDYQFDSYSSNVRLWGALSSTTSAPYNQLYINGSATPPIAGFQFSTSRVVEFTPDTARHSIVLDMLGDKIAYDNNLSTFTSTNRPVNFNVLSTASLYLFARNQLGQATSFADGKIFRYKHYQNMVAVRDMLPVRVGATGYMYDTVTGRLFGNNGTGDFEYGLDVIPALSAAKAVEYIGFTGTQGIDTGIYGTLNTSIMTKSQRTILPTAGSVFIGSRTSATANNITFSQTANTAAILDFGDYTATRITAPVTTIAITDLIETYNSKDYRYAKSLTTGAIVQGKTAYSTAFTTPLTLHIGMKTTGYDGTGFENWSGRFYACQIWDGQTLVRDFVPCRIGTTGYLYDRVSQTLFGNIGTGDFTLGPDVG